MTLGQFIKDVLETKKISQVDLAQRVNLTPAQISRIISGERGTSIDTLILIADALNIERDILLKVASGSLPQKSDIDQETEELNHLVDMLTPDKRKLARSILNALLEGPAQAMPAKKPRPTKAKA